MLAWILKQRKSRHTIVIDLCVKGLERNFGAEEYWRQMGQYALFTGKWEKWIWKHLFGAGAIPYTNSSLGPDFTGAVCGGYLEFGETTSWAVNTVKDWDDFPQIQFDSNNKRWNQIEQMAKALVDDAKEDYYIYKGDAGCINSLIIRFGLRISKRR